MITVTVKGDCGTGKTSLILWMRRVLENHGVEVQYENPDAPELSRSEYSECWLSQHQPHKINGPVVILETTT